MRKFAAPRRVGTIHRHELGEYSYGLVIGVGGLVEAACATSDVPQQTIGLRELKSPVALRCIEGNQLSPDVHGFAGVTRRAAFIAAHGQGVA
jgi:hypothetical protein